MDFVVDPPNDQGSGPLVLRMDGTIDGFYPQRREFLEDLGVLFDVPLDQLRLVVLRSGCVIVELIVPNAVRNAFTAAKHKVDPPITAFLRKWKVKRVTDSLTVEASPIRTSRKSLPRDESLSWLHISDFHIRIDDDAEEFSRSIVVNALLKSLPGLLEEAELVPDIVFFTGDVAFSGTAPEYEKAKLSLTALRGRLPKPVPIVCIPGNHDVNQPAADVGFDAKLDTELTSMNAVRAHLLNDGVHAAERAQGFSRLEKFYDFVADGSSEFGLPQFDGRYFFAVVEELGEPEMKVGIAGLNSAWRSGKRPDGGKLVLGDHQLLKALEALEPAQIRIALVHHPPTSTRWYREFDAQRQRDLFQRFDFVLFGHEHDAWSYSVRKGNTGATHIAAGALFENERTIGSCNAVRLFRRSGMAEIFYWKYVERRDAWDRDVDRAHAGREEIGVDDSLKQRMAVVSKRRSTSASVLVGR